MPRRAPSLLPLVSGLLLLSASRSAAQADAPLGDAERGRVVTTTARLLDSLYVDRRLAHEMSAWLRDGLRNGRWDRIGSASAFADTVTAQLRAISHDQHVHLSLDARDSRLVENVTMAERKRRYDDAMQEITDGNFGIPETRILAGNVALLRMDNFIIPKFGSPALAAAMAMVNHSRALIIDLRHNGGGHSDQYVLMMSYFLDRPVKIGESFTRPDSAIEQAWTYAVVPGPRYDPGKPVYVLTSRQTFSAAEALAGALRRYRHAIVVGDTTRGGGHTGDFYPIGTRFMLFVPTGASTNGDDVEGAGLRPDVAVPSASALETAHRLALRTIVAAVTDTLWRRKLERIQREVEGSAAGTTTSE
jgi:C-terminal processing protease CtpA/Prc